MSSPMFIELGEKKVVGCSIYTSGIQSDFIAVWEEFVKSKDMIPYRINKGLRYSIEIYGEEFHTENKWLYMPCVEVSEFGNIPEKMVAKTIPAARYAVFTHNGDVSGIHDLFVHIYKKWLPESEFEQAFDFDIEVYDERFLGINNPDSVMQIYVPIRNKAVI